MKKGEIDDLRKWDIVDVIGTGLVSVCYLLSNAASPGSCVKKQYFPEPLALGTRGAVQHYEKEKEAFKLLEGKKHFPQLIAEDAAFFTYYMTYCGERLTAENLPGDWKQQAIDIDLSLTEAGIKHNDIFIKNITVKDGVLYLVDFGLWGHHATSNNNLIDTINELGKA